MGDAVVGLLGALVFIGVLMVLIYGASYLVRRASWRAAPGSSALTSGEWEIATDTELDGTVRVVLRRVTDRGRGKEELERLTVAQISPRSATWSQDLMNAQAEAEQRLAALQVNEQKQRGRR